MSWLLALITLTCAFLVGYAIRRGSICAVLATRGNLNNQLGVPLTLLELGPQHTGAVIELGASGIGEIAYTVATGRTLHGARAILEGHCFELPQVFNVLISKRLPCIFLFPKKSQLPGFERRNCLLAKSKY